jgi:hypothetical protein
MIIEDTKCGHCRYWTGGECRRFPPQAVIYPTDNQHPVMYLSSFNYPDRQATSDGCGEFKPL